ncbi:hypothetical protein B0H14DRAFT_3124112 [Mycena olivaceomarginata]|nr:hypothetical protein B0H14DRAFT_3124112 [Mycena olivaceomarginata]
MFPAIIARSGSPTGVQSPIYSRGEAYGRNGTVYGRILTGSYGLRPVDTRNRKANISGPYSQPFHWYSIYPYDSRVRRYKIITKNVNYEETPGERVESGRSRPQAGVQNGAAESVGFETAPVPDVTPTLDTATAIDVEGNPQINNDIHALVRGSGRHPDPNHFHGRRGGMFDLGLWLVAVGFRLGIGILSQNWRQGHGHARCRPRHPDLGEGPIARDGEKLFDGFVIVTFPVLRSGAVTAIQERCGVPLFFTSEKTFSRAAWFTTITVFTPGWVGQIFVLEGVYDSIHRS